jgi:DNA-binding protein H-NS
MDINLNALSLKELKDLQAQVARAIASFEDRKKKEALAELEDKARSMGFSLAELTGTSAGRKRTAAAAKFANPANPSETWTGRGRKPGWFAKAIAAGRSPSDLMI